MFDVGADARVGLFMVMEHLPGEDLRAASSATSASTYDRRDVAPPDGARPREGARGGRRPPRSQAGNVFLTTRDNGAPRVKLLDFGVSKILNDGRRRAHHAAARLGTPLYMSPEQAEGKDDTDGRADIWSLGAVLYEALAGAPPFPDRGATTARLWEF